jgi:hypothetical protein
VHFDLIDDVNGAEELLAAVCPLDAPVDDLEDRFRQMGEAELLLSPQRLQQDDDVVLGPGLVARLKVSHKLVPRDVLIQTLLLLAAQQGLDLDSFEDATQTDVAVVLWLEDGGQVEAALD